MLWIRGRSAGAPAPAVVAITERSEALSASAPSGNVFASHRSPCFTGRERLLTNLHDGFVADDNTSSTRPQAIHGVAGIGKTQVALAYAARYGDEYRHVLWANAANLTTLTSGFVVLAHLLELPEKDEPDHYALVTIVKSWLVRNERWLLLLDNADDLDLVYGFLPSTSKGHALLSTRIPAAGASDDEATIGKMNLYEATLFLLKRTELLVTGTAREQIDEEIRTQAEAIASALEGLPLALEYAGAYVRETRCSLAVYLDRYLMQRKQLMQHQDALLGEHPGPVMVSLLLSLQHIKQDTPLAAELLRLCAFLAPDVIPEEILIKGAVELGSVLRPVAANPLKLHEALEQLQRFSLLQRLPDTRMCSISRVVQTILKDELKKATQQQWARKAVHAVALAFSGVEKSTQLHYQSYLPQVRTCAALCEQYELAFGEAAQLFNEAASYLQDHARYIEAESFYWRVLMMREHMLGSEDPFTASSMNNLAQLYRTQRKYEQAEPLYQKALLIYESALGPMHPFTASSLHTLAVLYHEQGKYQQAEQCYQRSLAIRERVLGAEHSDVASVMEHYAVLLREMNRAEEAAKLEATVKAIGEKQ